MKTKSRVGFTLPHIISTDSYRRLTVGWDNDGVLHYFRAGVCDYLDTIKHNWTPDRDPQETDNSWNFFEKWGMKGADFKKVCDDGVEAGYVFNNNVRPNAVQTVNAVKRLGHKNIMITDRAFGKTPASSEQRTRDWILENHFEIDEVYFSADKTIVKTDIFVEDKWQNYDALEAVGTECWLINRSWNNLDDEVNINDGRKRINDVIEFLPKVIEKSFVLS